MKNVLILDKEEITARQQLEDLLPFISHSTKFITSNLSRFVSLHH